MQQEEKLYSLRQLIQWIWCSLGTAAVMLLAILEIDDWRTAVVIGGCVAGYFFSLWIHRDYFAQEAYRIEQEWKEEMEEFKKSEAYKNYK